MKQMIINLTLLTLVSTLTGLSLQAFRRPSKPSKPPHHKSAVARTTVTLSSVVSTR